MSSNVFGDRFYGNRQPGWHNLGTVFTDRPTPVEAVNRSGCGFNIVKIPLVGHMNTPFGTQILETGRTGLFREPTPDDDQYRYLGHVSEDYTYLQNVELARLIEPIAELWPVETVGALGNGETIFITLDAGEAEVKKDRVKQYFLVTDTRNGGVSLKIAFTPVRVVCQNTLVSGLHQALVSAAITHNEGINLNLLTRIRLLERMQTALAQTMATFEQLASAAITADAAQEIFAAAYPMPVKSKAIELLDYPDEADTLGELYDHALRAQGSWEYHYNRVSVMREDVRQLFGRFNDENPNVAMTGWAAYNAVVEYADYRNRNENTAQSTLFGPRSGEKKRAFAAAMSMLSEGK